MTTHIHTHTRERERERVLQEGNGGCGLPLRPTCVERRGGGRRLSEDFISKKPLAIVPCSCHVCVSPPLAPHSPASFPRVRTWWVVTRDRPSLLCICVPFLAALANGKEMGSALPPQAKRHCERDERFRWGCEEAKGHKARGRFHPSLALVALSPPFFPLTLHTLVSVYVLSRGHLNAHPSCCLLTPFCPPLFPSSHQTTLLHTYIQRRRGTACRPACPQSRSPFSRFFRGLWALSTLCSSVVPLFLGREQRTPFPLPSPHLDFGRRGVLQGHTPYPSCLSR